MLISSFSSTNPGGYSGLDALQQSSAQARKEDPAGKTAASRSSEEAAAAKNELTPQEESAIVQLQSRDRAVRAHEQAHLSVAGGLAVSGASFDYQTGPDGRDYAIGGEVQIDVSPGRDPEETLSKAEHIRAAALAPADPSPQDLAVAASAAQMATEARAELARAQTEQTPQPSELSSMLSSSSASGSERRSWYVPPAAQNRADVPGLGASVDIYA
ncbi:MAG: hypothetical protein FWD77_00810 [Betaproteobacteria bacterium]|nr:hypothetical protein [Betaproteobacteria bacterium]